MAQSKISFIADDSHFNYVGTLPWNNDNKEVTLFIRDSDYPDDSTPEFYVSIYHTDYHRNDIDVECKKYYFIADNAPELSNCYVGLHTDSRYRGWNCDWAYFNGLHNNGTYGPCLDICNDDGDSYSAGNISGTVRCDEKDIGEISRSKSVTYRGIKISLEQDD